MHETSVNTNLCTLFDLVYNNIVPKEIGQYFTDTYLFCLYKDPHNLTKLRPLRVPSALRRIVASHVAKTGVTRFAQHLLPFNFAVRVDGGMDFVIKTMQLSIEKFITQRQEQDPPQLPTRAALFADIKRHVQLCLTRGDDGHNLGEFPRIAAACPSPLRQCRHRAPPMGRWHLEGNIHGRRRQPRMHSLGHLFSSCPWLNPLPSWHSAERACTHKTIGRKPWR